MKNEGPNEIAFYDILQVIWKRKWFVLGVVVVSMTSMAVYLSFQKSYYKISTIIEPVVLRQDRGGNDVYIDSPATIQNVIESGVLNIGIVEKFGEANVKKEELKFKVRVMKPTARIVVSMVHSSSVRAGKIMDWLVMSLNDYYQNDADRLKANEVKRIESLKNKLTLNQANQKGLSKKHRLTVDRLNIERDLAVSDIKRYEASIKVLDSRTQDTKNKLRMLRRQHGSASVAQGNEKSTDAMRLNSLVPGLQADKNNFVGFRIDFLERALFALEEQKASKRSLILKNEIDIRKLENRITENILDFKDRERVLLFQEEDLKTKIEKAKQNVIFQSEGSDWIYISDDPQASSTPVKPKRMVLMFLAFVSGVFLSIPCIYFLEHIEISKES
ncbi:MAG: Wzz/FepE/Etk N-terminal domain-containing protein [Desulfobacter sp.]